MEVKQIYDVVNPLLQEVLGREEVLNIDLTNVVDVGTELLNAKAYDNFAKALVDRIGMTYFVNKKLSSTMSWMFMDAWTYGSVVQRVRTELPNAVENPSWELEDGRVYTGKKFTQPKVYVKYWNSKTSYRIDLSFTRKQLEEAFTSASALDQFLSMLFMSVENAITINFDNLARMVINNFIAATVKKEYGSAGLGTKSGVRAINLLKRYNDYYGTDLEADKAMLDTDFLKFAGYEIKNVLSQIEKPSSLFNMGGYTGWTRPEEKVGYFLDRFYNATATYLQADTFNKELVNMPEFHTTPFFQGSGENFDLASCQTIDVTATTAEGNVEEVKVTGLIGCVFDKWSLGLRQYQPDITSEFIPTARFYNNYYHQDCAFYNDFNENFVVFFIA